mmetsp:Transcript_22990/g.33021  ORF Transcript_22990/g.33021 Transcript_22990/m.33021 type:complete len:464 (-) Transcript_22990:804-2195(-)
MRLPEVLIEGVDEAEEGLAARGQSGAAHGGQQQAAGPADLLAAPAAVQASLLQGRHQAHQLRRQRVREQCRPAGHVQAHTEQQLAAQQQRAVAAGQAVPVAADQRVDGTAVSGQAGGRGQSESLQHGPHPLALQLGRTQQSHGAGSQTPHVPVPVAHAARLQVVQQLAVHAGVQEPHLRAQGQEGPAAAAQREVVGQRHQRDADAQREGVGALATHVLLQGCGGAAAAVHFAVEKRGLQHGPGQGRHPAGQLGRCVGPGEGPAAVAGGVAHVGPDAVLAPQHVELHGLRHQRHHLAQPVRQQQAAPGQLGHAQTGAVPAAVLLAVREQLQHGPHDVVRQQPRQPHGDPPHALGRRPPHHGVLVAQRAHQAAQDVLHLRGHLHLLLIRLLFHRRHCRYRRRRAQLNLQRALAPLVAPPSQGGRQVGGGQPLEELAEGLAEQHLQRLGLLRDGQARLQHRPCQRQ